jgi:hypothetical protein
MPRPFFILAIVSGILSSLVSFLFAYFFNNNLLDFSEVIPYWKIVSIDFSLSFCSVGIFYLAYIISRKYYRIFFYVLFTLCSICSVLIPITAKIPNFEFPEFYPTFMLPLHLIFCVIFVSLSTLIIKHEISHNANRHKQV